MFVVRSRPEWPETLRGSRLNEQEQFRVRHRLSACQKFVAHHDRQHGKDRRVELTRQNAESIPSNKFHDTGCQAPGSA